MLVDNEAFLTQLQDMFQRCSEAGSVWITLKRLEREGAEGQTTYACLVRAKSDHGKLSTTVQPNSVVAFSNQLNQVLRRNSSKLKREA